MVIIKEHNTALLYVYKFYRRLVRFFIGMYYEAQYADLQKKAGSVGCGVILDYGIFIDKPNNVFIGNNVFVGRNVYLIANEKIIVGEFTTIGAGCKLITSNHNYKNSLTPIRLQSDICKPITLVGDIWLGYNVIILPGVTLGKGCIVGAGSVVTKSFDDYSVIVGAPARCISKRVNK